MADVVASVVWQMISDVQKPLRELSEATEVSDEVMSLLSVLNRIHWLLNHSQTNALVVRSEETIRHLAYKIEDVLERCSVDFAEMVQKNEPGSSKRFSWKRLLGKFFPARNDVSVLEDIKGRISILDPEILDFLKVFPVGAIEITSDEQLVATCGQRWLRPTHPRGNETHFVGMSDELEKLVSRVVEKETRVISIWGVTGLGKTTIARNIYYHPKVRDSFKAFAWVCFTHGCKISILLPKILRQLGPRKVNESGQEKTMIDQLKEVQRQKNCLIVLDNIQDIDHWRQLSPAFQIEDKGSVILLTTREKIVAEVGYPHKLRFLNRDEGWDLLKKYAFPREDGPDIGMFPRIGKEMVQKSEYLPSSISILGRILSSKYDLGDWQMVNDNVSEYLQGHQIDGDEQLLTILDSNYDNLPYYLKQCFLYLGNFRENEDIDVEDIYFLWIAEGMVSSVNENREEPTLYIAKRYEEAMDSKEEAALDIENEDREENTVDIANEDREETAPDIANEYTEESETIPDTVNEEEMTMDITNEDMEEMTMDKGNGDMEETKLDIPNGDREETTLGIANEYREEKIPDIVNEEEITLGIANEDMEEMTLDKANGDMEETTLDEENGDEVETTLEIANEYREETISNIVNEEETTLDGVNGETTLDGVNGETTLDEATRDVDEMTLDEANGDVEPTLHIAERYLTELTISEMVCMQLQENELSASRRFQSCFLHKPAQGLSLWEGEKEGFRLKIIDFCSEKQPMLDSASMSGETRRLAIHFNRQVKLGEIDLLSMDYLRSLFLLNSDKEYVELPWKMFAFGKFKLLRVLNVVRCKFEGRKLPTGIGGLINLRYLGLLYCDLDELPSSISNLRNLRVLNVRVRENCHLGIPNVLNQLLLLHHLRLPYYTNRAQNQKVKFDGLLELKTLVGFNSIIHDLNTLSNLKKLRHLGAHAYNNESLKSLLGFIMIYGGAIWTSLTIENKCDFTSKEGLAILEEVLMGPNLHALTLSMVLIHKFPDCGTHVSSKLTQLKLMGCKIKEDPMEALGKFPNLQKLCLGYGAFVGRKMTVQATNFPKLAYLEIRNLPYFEEWSLDEGSMLNLSTLIIRRCPKLKMIPDGLKSISNLKFMEIELAPEAFADVSEEEYHKKFDFVPSCNIRLYSITLEYKNQEELAQIRRQETTRKESVITDEGLQTTDSPQQKQHKPSEQILTDEGLQTMEAPEDALGHSTSEGQLRRLTRSDEGLQTTDAPQQQHKPSEPILKDEGLQTTETPEDALGHSTGEGRLRRPTRSDEGLQTTDAPQQQHKPSEPILKDEGLQTTETPEDALGHSTGEGRLRRPTRSEYFVVDEPKLTIFTHLTTDHERKVMKSSHVSTPFQGATDGIPLVKIKEFELRYMERVRRDWPDVECQIKKMRVNAKRHGLYNKEFFNILMTPGKWLEYDQMEPCMEGFLGLQKRYPDLVAKNVALMNVKFTQVFQSEYTTMDRPIDVPYLMRYINGSINDWPSTSWGNSKLVLAPVHLPKHWVVMKIYVYEQQIIFLDSAISATPLSRLDEEVKGIISLVPETLKALDFEGAKKSWSCLRLGKFPQQKKSGECGAYVLRAIAAEMTDGDPYSLNDEEG